MAHFARVEGGVVVNVIVADQEFIDGLSDKGAWVQTSYRTHGGVHPEGAPLRKNFAGKGFTYDAGKDAFIPPKPYDSWLLDDTSCLWAAPVAKPTDGKAYDWDEGGRLWVARD